jgi:hypothetical protein
LITKIVVFRFTLQFRTTKPVYFLKVFYLNDPNHDIRVPFEFRQPWAMICFVWLFWLLKSDS